MNEALLNRLADGIRRLDETPRSPSEGFTHAYASLQRSFGVEDIRALLTIIREERSAREKAERERDEARGIVRDIHWMAVRYADGRMSYAPGMCNDALRKAYDGGWMTYTPHPQHDHDPQYAREGDKPEYRSLADRALAAEDRATAAESELARLRGELAGGWRVRELAWVERIGVTGTFDAYSTIGHFIASVTDDGKGHWFIVGLGPSNYVGTTVEAAKAAAQADYEARIRAAIEPAPGQETKP